MSAMRPPMGRQIEYEIDPGKPPEGHPEVHLSVSMEDSIHWSCCHQRFRVMSVYPDPTRNPNAPAQLFYREFPNDNIEHAYHVNSGPARSEVGEGYWYEPIFEFEDGSIFDAPEIRTT
jgi:hypothetical protein